MSTHPHPVDAACASGSDVANVRHQVLGSAYATFRTCVRVLAAIGYLLIGLYAGCALVWIPSVFGMIAALSCIATAAGLYIVSSVLLILADIADALVVRSEEDIR